MNSTSGHQLIILAAGRGLRLSTLAQARPKSLLEIEDTPILGHSLAILGRRGFRKLTLVVGYLRQQIEAAFGPRYAGIEIDYVENPLFAESEHGWSLYCARDSWRREQRPVVFMDADNLYDPMMIDRMMSCDFENVMLVDQRLHADDRDDELVLGEQNIVTGLRRGRRGGFENFAGGFVGINRFSSKFMGSLFDYMDEFFEARGRMQKYERVFDAFINDTGARAHYLEVGDLPWVNVNHASDYEHAQAIARRMLSDATT